MPRNRFVTFTLLASQRVHLHRIGQDVRHYLESKEMGFDAMELDDLHLTVVFLGRNKCNRDVLIAKLAEIDVSDVKLPVDGVCTFPPAKNNLVILKLKS